MKIELIIDLLNGIGAVKIKTIDSGNGQKVGAQCPFAQWRHVGGKDHNPSFIVFVNEDDRSWCKCHSCGFSGSLSDLLYKLEKTSGREYSKFHLILLYNENSQKVRPPPPIWRIPGVDYSGPEWSQAGAKDHLGCLDMARDAKPLSQEHVDLVDQMVNALDDESRDYLKNKRGFTDVTIARWKLGWHPGARRISIPQYDFDGRLVNIGGRDVPTFLGWDHAPWMHSLGFKKELFLFGEDKFDVGDCRGTAFLVEGMFDAIYLDQCGLRNVAAMCGSYLSKNQQNKLIKWFNRIIIIPDGDEPGRQAAKRIKDGEFGCRTRVNVYDTPDGKDPDQLTLEQIEDMKKMFSIA